jgi:hypothetical protein
MGPDGVRTARVEHTANGDTRVCEIQQLDGAALTSCQSTLACTDCQPGWCATTVPELVSDKYCIPGTHYPPFRFVLGASACADPTNAADITIVCDEASLTPRARGRPGRRLAHSADGYGGLGQAGAKARRPSAKPDKAHAPLAP